MVGEEEAVEDEVAVIGEVAEVAAVAVVFLAVCGFGAEALGRLDVARSGIYESEGG